MIENFFMSDTPQRIACDISPKLSIRFGETLKSYMGNPSRDPATLKMILILLQKKYIPMNSPENGFPVEGNRSPDICA